MAFVEETLSSKKTPSDKEVPSFEETQQKAEQGDGEAQYLLASMYWEGNGTLVDKKNPFIG
ncbi:hypothetical protein [Treponema phagedenis]|nr:hypothetical protein [Treponema phagedenis]QEJ95050.1 hypothetical protein FUT79_07455 [Treponema phagedenis]QEK00975.1 hypothetical protein FUT84_07300 [Treponema phagedenis]QEK05984.1 hypothetical protein FUT80_04195 [Treponema phagedenis]QSH94490.1 hypothetical protein C5O78_05450 [Treponema phagedenis]